MVGRGPVPGTAYGCLRDSNMPSSNIVNASGRKVGIVRKVRGQVHVLQWQVDVLLEQPLQDLFTSTCA